LVFGQKTRGRAPFCEIAHRETPITLLRDTNAERQRMTLTHLISEGFKGWHGVKLHQPDWSDRSHSIAFSAELVKEDLLVFAIFNAYGGPRHSVSTSVGLYRFCIVLSGSAGNCIP
jgi:hypothetical protein